MKKHGRIWNMSPGRGILLGHFWFKDTAMLKAHCADTASEISDATQLRDDGSRVPWSAAFCTGESTIHPSLKTDALLNDRIYCPSIQLICCFFPTLLQKFCHCNLQRVDLQCLEPGGMTVQPLSHNNMPAICWLVVLIAALSMSCAFWCVFQGCYGGDHTEKDNLPLLLRFGFRCICRFCFCYFCSFLAFACFCYSFCFFHTFTCRTLFFGSFWYFGNFCSFSAFAWGIRTEQWLWHKATALLFKPRQLHHDCLLNDNSFIPNSKAAR